MRVGDAHPDAFGEFDERLHRLRVPTDITNHRQRRLSFGQPVRQVLECARIASRSYQRPRPASHAEVDAVAVGWLHEYLARGSHIHRAGWFGGGYLHGSRDQLVECVDPRQLVRPLRIPAHDADLIRHVLLPLDRPVATARD